MAKRSQSPKPVKLSKTKFADFTLIAAQSIHEYEQAIETRTPSFSKVRVVTLDAPEDYDNIPEGCVMGYFAPEGNKTLNTLFEAASAGNLSKVDQLHSRLAKSQLKQLESLGKKPVGIAKAPLWGELRYRTKTISRALFAETATTIDVRVFPYNGGALYDEDFQLVNYPLTANRKPLEGLLIKRPPRLSALEADILKKVPREQTESNIGVEAGLWGKIVRAVAKATKKVVDATVDAAKRVANWVTENKTAAAEITMLTMDLATMMTGGCPLLPGATSVQSIKSSSSAADLLALRRSALMGEIDQTLKS